MTISTRPTGVKWMGVLASALLLAGATAANAAGRVFFDDFESGTTSKWTPVPNGNNCKAVKSSVDGVASHSGSFNAECNWNGVVSWQDAQAYSSMELTKWDYNREFLIRFWLRYSSDFDHKAGAKALRLYPGDDSFYLGAQMERTGGPLFIYFESINGSSGPISYGDGTIFGDGKWHRVDIYIKHNTAGASDGTVKVFRDGVVQVQGTNIVTAKAGSKWYPMAVMSNWSSNPGWEHDASNHVYWDDFEIFSDMGTGASSGTMADGTIQQTGTTTKVPSPPANVTVQ